MNYICEALKILPLCVLFLFHPVLSVDNVTLYVILFSKLNCKITQIRGYFLISFSIRTPGIEGVHDMARCHGTHDHKYFPNQKIASGPESKSLTRGGL